MSTFLNGKVYVPKYFDSLKVADFYKQKFVE
jgi:hypothetical protein